MSARWWHPLDDGRIQCDVCPRECRLRDGQRGFCFVRAREGDEMVLTTYGRSSGFCVDPIEKEAARALPPGHVRALLRHRRLQPRLQVLPELGHVGRPARWTRSWTRRRRSSSPRRPSTSGCQSVAFTYNDPVIFAEYAIDTALACHDRGVSSVAVTAGYVNPETRRDFFSVMDAANVDLKGFTDDFYEKITGAKLRPVPRHAELPRPRDRRLGRDHHTAHPRLQRLRRRAACDGPLGHVRARPRCPSPRHGVSTPTGGCGTYRRHRARR